MATRLSMRTLLALASAAAALAPSAPAQESCELTEVLAPDPVHNDRFGHAVAAAGDWLFVGTPFDDDAGNQAGCIHVFERQGLTWSLHSTLRGSDTDAGDWFGNALAARGDALIVGARHADGPPDQCGGAYIFRLEDDQWVQEAHLRASDGASGDEFGIRVGIDGDQAVIGASMRHGIGPGSGGAYIFSREDGQWTQGSLLLPSNPEAGDHFGESVAIDSGRILIGSPRGNGDVPDSGVAYLFEAAGGDWAEHRRFYSPTPKENDQFGNSVSLAGDQASIGARLDDFSGTNAGRVFIFRADGGEWALEAAIAPPDASAGDEFGIAIASAPGVIIAGSFLDSVGDNGSAYQFRLDAGQWVMETKFKASDAAPGDQFGGSVAIVGDFAYCGARLDDTAGPEDAGAVYIHSIVPICRADLDQDGAATIFDFLSYQNLFIAGDKIANFDCDSKFDLFDFLAFQNVFVGGCE
jgi:hypothetical protein